MIFDLLQLFLLYFYNLYTRSEYQDYLDILESVVKAVSLAHGVSPSSTTPRAEGTVAVAFIAFFAWAFALPRSIVMAPGSPIPFCSPLVQKLECKLRGHLSSTKPGEGEPKPGGAVAAGAATTGGPAEGYLWLMAHS